MTGVPLSYLSMTGLMRQDIAALKAIAERWESAVNDRIPERLMTAFDEHLPGASEDFGPSLKTSVNAVHINADEARRELSRALDIVTTAHGHVVDAGRARAAARPGFKVN